MAKKTSTLVVRLSPELRADIEKHVDKTRKNHPDYTASDAARELIAKGLKAAR